MALPLLPPVSAALPCPLMPPRRPLPTPPPTLLQRLPRRQAERHQGAAGQDAVQRGGHGEEGGRSGAERVACGVTALGGCLDGWMIGDDMSKQASTRRRQRLCCQRRRKRGAPSLPPPPPPPPCVLGSCMQVGWLSGGEKARLALAKFMLTTVGGGGEGAGGVGVRWVGGSCDSGSLGWSARSRA